MADVRVRQALRYAIDMETICETLFQGSAVPANALAPDANLKGGDLNDYNYNPEKAKELLAGSEYSVTEISELLGFESVTYFERVFKKLTDKTPLKYRRICSGDMEE